MRKSDARYFQKARCIATISDFPKIHVGCIAIYQGSIIGIGCNTNKTHPIQKYYNRFRIGKDFTESESLLPKMHAEINCIKGIRNLDIDFSKVKLYIYRIRKDQVYGIARPCPSCMAAIKDLGITDIYYTTDSGFAHENIKFKNIEKVGVIGNV